MSSISGTSVGQSAAGAGPAERVQASETKKSEPKDRSDKKRIRDEVEVDATHAADAVRNLKGNDQEETAEDRREHASYDPAGGAEVPPPPPSIDVEG